MHKVAFFAIYFKMLVKIYKLVNKFEKRKRFCYQFEHY